MKLPLVILLACCSLVACSTRMQETQSANELPTRAEVIGSLFTGAEQDINFNRMAELFPVSTMTAASESAPFPAGIAAALPESYDYDGKARSVEDFLNDTDTAALLVVQQGKIRYEQYWRTGGPEVQWLSMSVAKSFTSAALGIAVHEGLIGSIEDPADLYLPWLKGSAYDGVRIKDILQMSSGTLWNEDYSDPEADVFKLGAIMAAGGSLQEMIKTLKRERDPGTFNQYNSTDTQVLGLLLRQVTGRSVADYMEEKLWHPLGMESNGYWMTDDEGAEMTFGGLNATARDYAKLGQLYLQNGNWQGRQIVPSDWVKASVTPDAPHLQPGENPLSDYVMGYGYQWWIPEGKDGEFSAIGVYNQFIYVHPPSQTVIVKLSANSNYGMTDDESSWRELETMALFRSIVRHL
ncbi:MAG: serine hydrolase [Pseudomonadales bacterium]|nr:serine hydrolase [Pseudomonadales bacterium]